MSGTENGDKLSEDQQPVQRAEPEYFDGDEGENKEWSQEGEPLHFDATAVIHMDGARAYWKIKIEDALKGIQKDRESERQKIRSRYPGSSRN